MKVFIQILVLLTFAVNTFAQKHYVFAEATESLEILRNHFTITNVPEYIRFVPNHPDDPKDFEGPIDDGKIRFNSFMNTALGLGYALELKKFNLRVGFTCGLPLVIDDFRSRNYTNDPGSDTRGYGAALTFYGLGNTRFNYNLRPYFRFCYLLNDDDGIFIEYEANYQHFNIINGWDRYDQNQYYYIWEVGKLLNHNFNIGYEFNIDRNAVDIFIGNTFASKFDFLIDVNCKLKPRLYGGMRCNLNIFHINF
jgi:hypothetical protein